MGKTISLASYKKSNRDVFGLGKYAVFMCAAKIYIYYNYIPYSK